MKLDIGSPDEDAVFPGSLSIDPLANMQPYTPSSLPPRHNFEGLTPQSTAPMQTQPMRPIPLRSLPHAKPSQPFAKPAHPQPQFLVQAGRGQMLAPQHGAMQYQAPQQPMQRQAPQQMQYLNPAAPPPAPQQTFVPQPLSQPLQFRSLPKVPKLGQPQQVVQRVQQQQVLC